MSKDEIKLKISILVSDLLYENPNISEYDIQVAIYEMGRTDACKELMAENGKKSGFCC